MENNLDTIAGLKGQLSSYFTPVVGFQAGFKIWEPDPNDQDGDAKREISRVSHKVLDAKTISEVTEILDGSEFASAANQLQNNFKYSEVISILQRIRASLPE
jgi:hypothetical protein